MMGRIFLWRFRWAGPSGRAGDSEGGEGLTVSG